MRRTAEPSGAEIAHGSEAMHGTEIHPLSNRKVPFRVGGGGGRCEMEVFVADVVKPLAVVSAIVDAGNEVVSAESGSCIRILATGEKILLRRAKGMYTSGRGGGVGGGLGRRDGFHRAGVDPHLVRRDADAAAVGLEEEQGRSDEVREARGTEAHGTGGAGSKHHFAFRSWCGHCIPGEG